MNKFDQGFALFSEGDFEKAIDLLKEARDESQENSSSNSRLETIYQLIAEANLELGNLRQAKKNYLKANNTVQAAFTAVLSQDIREAKSLYEKSPDSLARKWGLFLCKFFDDKNPSIELPGFLCTRLFAESTFGYFIRFGLNDYLKEFIKHSKQIEVFFPELRKYIGSAYLSCDKYDKSIEILNQALKDHSNDSEIYFKLAQDYMHLNRTNKAIENFQKTLQLLPGHIASIKFLERLS